MKNTIRALSVVMLCLMLCLMLCACTGNAGTTTGTTTAPTNPTTPPTNLYNYDPNRPLPQLIEKFVAHDAAGNFVVAQDGAAMAKIVIPADCAMKVEFAADDLQSYLNQITGAAFEIITDDQITADGNYILVGPTAKTLELGEGVFEAYPADERYTIRVADNYLILCGNDGGNFECTQFAVTRFLEEAGCGWYAPGQLWQVVPSTQNLSVKAVDKDFTPRFQSRNMGVGSVSSRLYLGGYNTINGHTLPGMVPTTAYAEHPEYFALVNGSREPDPNEYWQYCYTNPDLAAAVAQGVINHFNRSTNATQMTMSITANDGWDRFWCECDTCVGAGNHADQMLIFANNVAAIVSQVYPEKKVSILAYHSTFLPPEKVTYTHPNVEVMFCLETAPFVDLSKGELVHEGYHSTNRVTYTQSWKDSCAAWIEKANVENVSIWAWYCIGSGADAWGKYPWVQGNTISNNLDLWESMGVREIFVDCGADARDLRWPLYYAAAKCMWNEGYDAETWLYDACIKLYGDAADEMFLYYRHLADAAAQYGGTQDSIVWVPPKVSEVYYPSYEYIDAAINAAVAKTDSLTNLQKARVNNQAGFWTKVTENILA